MRAIVATVLCVAILALNAQDKVRVLRFVPWFGDHPLVLNADEKLPDGTSVRVTTFRFYAGIPVVSGDGQANLLPYEYHLVDAEDTISWSVVIARSAPPYFLLGVDSLTNVSGAFGGDLDPIKGMYWAWNSGYVNLKLEGSSPACPTRRNEFQFHLGGYQPPYATAQQVALPGDVTGPIEVRMDVATLLQHIDLRVEHNVMSPGEQAVALSRTAANMFSCHANGK
jgi:hypothetical protein